MRCLFRAIGMNLAALLVALVGLWAQFVVAMYTAPKPFKASLVLGVTVGYTVALILAFWLSEMIRERKNRIRIVADHGALEKHRRAVIFTVGKPDVLIKFAIQRLTPDYVGFICTDWSEPTADGVIADLNLKSDRAQKKLVDARSGSDITGAVRHLVDWARRSGVRDSEIVVDITGGLTTLSVAAFAVAEEAAVDAQYVLSRFDPTTNKPIPGEQDVILFSRGSRP